MIRRFSPRWSALLPILFLALMVLAPYWKLTLMRGFIITDDIGNSDLMGESFPYRYYMSDALKHGDLPLWLPSIYGGIPVLAGAQAGVCYPINLLLFGLLPPYAALNIVILLTIMTAAVSMFLYAREIGANTPGALVAGITLAYSGFFVSHIRHLSMVGSVCWFPLGLYFIERSFAVGIAGQRLRPLLWLGMVFGLQNLSGHIQAAYYAGLVYCAYYAFRLFGTRVGGRHPKGGKAVRTSPAEALGLFALAMAIGVGLSAVQLLPTYELVSLTQRAGGVAFDYASKYPYDPADILNFVYPYARGDIGNATYVGHGVFWEGFGYVGLLSLLLAVYATVTRWRQWHVKYFCCAAVVAYLMVLGPATPLFKVAFDLIPGMKFFRFPTRFLFVVGASVAGLAALGTTQLVARFGPRPGRSATRAQGTPWLGSLIVVLVSSDLLYFQLRQNPIVDADKWLAPPRTAEMLRTDTTLFRIYSPAAAITHVAAIKQARGWEGDLQPFIDQREILQVSSNVLYGIFAADGYAQLTPNYVVDLWGDQNRRGLIMKTFRIKEGQFISTPQFLRIMNLFNVKYILTSVQVATDALEPIWHVGNVFVYRNPNVMPRAFIAPGARLAHSAEDAEAILISEDFDPSQEAILYEAPAMPLSGQMQSSIPVVRRYRANEVVIDVAAAGSGLLILSDTYYPGWRAEVDGRAAPILKANLCQRAVAIPAGSHRVRFVFESGSIRAGLAVTASALLVVVVLMMVLQRRSGVRAVEVG